MTSALPPVVDDSAQATMDLERQYLLQNYTRYPLVIARGKGCYVYDTAGRRYLDFLSGIGVNALGHAHPRIVKVIREQAGLTIHCSNLYYNQYQGPLAKRLAEISGLQRTFFANSGAEAMEGALKMARAHGHAIHAKKFEIISLENSFHGRTLGALSITGQAKYRADFEPLLPGVRFVPPNDIAALEAAFNERTAGMVLEMIQGEGGIYPLTHEYVVKARQLADRYAALLIAADGQCGVGRPGTFFAYQRAHPVILPDVMAAAKPLGVGIPLGVIVANEKAAAAIKPGMHGSTFGGGPLACRVALEALDVIEELLPAIQRVGGYFHVKLNELARKHSFVKEVRGFGLMIGVELTVPGKQPVLDAMDEGLLMNCTHDTVLRFLPPYIATEKDVDPAMKVLAKLFAKVKRRIRGNAKKAGQNARPTKLGSTLSLAWYEVLPVPRSHRRRSGGSDLPWFPGYRCGRLQGDRRGPPAGRGRDRGSRWADRPSQGLWQAVVVPRVGGHDGRHHLRPGLSHQSRRHHAGANEAFRAGQVPAQRQGHRVHPRIPGWQERYHHSKPLHAFLRASAGSQARSRVDRGGNRPLLGL